MAHNALPPNLGNLLKLANKMAGGLTALGQSLNITQLSAATLQAQLNAFAAAQTDFNTTRDARQAASTLCTDSHTAIYEWLLKGRDVLLPYLGRSWSAAWISAGFVNHSTAVPTYVGDQLNLLGLISDFYTANPNYEDAAIGVTGTAGATLKTTSEAADTAFDAAKSLATTKKAARDVALEALKSSMRMLVRILDELLDADDPRWATFGLNMPDADTTPASPANLVASFADGPVLLASCDAVQLATRYRWRIKLGSGDGIPSGREHEIAAGADRQGAAGAVSGVNGAGRESDFAKSAERECLCDPAGLECGDDSSGGTCFRRSRDGLYFAGARCSFVHSS